MEKDKVYFSYQQVRSNFFKTYLLVIIMALLAFGVATLIGYFLNDLRMGLLIGAVVALVVIPLEILTAKIAIKTMTGGGIGHCRRFEAHSGSFYRAQQCAQRLCQRHERKRCLYRRNSGLD
ncbi:MAG: hypothetical protein RRY34_04880 [Victivallaceae bacterium]